MIRAELTPTISKDWIEPLLAEFRLRALAGFRNLDSEAKADGSAVTALDRDVSELVKDSLRENFPQAGFISEEEAAPYLPDAEFQWVLDPIDGTAGFVRGYPTWGLGLGLMRNREPVEGCLSFPLLDETYLCQSGEILLNGRELIAAPPPSLRDLENVLVGSALHGQIPMHKLNEIKLRNFGSNLYHLTSLAAGRAEAVISPAAYLWDIVPALPMTRGQGHVERYVDGGAFSVEDLFASEAGRKPFKLRAPLVVGPPEQVERIVSLLK